MTGLPETETVGPAASAAVRLETLPAGFRVGGRYEIVRLLGRGGFAVVYLARDLDLRREVALKVLRADRLSASALARMRREVAIARDAASPRLIRIFDLGRAGDLVYLSMEPITGATLRERLADGALPVAEAERIAVAVLEGLAVLHRLGIAHRDVKPANVLLGPDGEVKLADFGLARRWQGDETRHTADATLVGTLDYLSPEQALDSEVDPRSDLFSLGVVLFETLTGRLPYQASSSLGGLLARFQRPAPGVRTLEPHVPRRLDRAVTRLLARRPEHRFASAEAVLAALRTGRGLGSRAWRRRARGWVAAAAVASTVAAVTIWRLSERPRFEQLVATDDEVRAQSADGRILWRLTARLDQLRSVRLRDGAPLRIVGLPRSPDEFGREVNSKLWVFDADTGARLRAVDLPDGSGFFSRWGYSDRFSAELVARDLDGDGVDEVLISFQHVLLWPSYTVLYEPRIDRARVVFVASGHHRFVAALDVDEDGRAELLFIGINNRMGWFNGLAAVHLKPELNENAEQMLRSPPPTTPDRPDHGPARLAWYALLPLDAGFLPIDVSIDADRRVIQVAGVGGGSELGFDGFPVGSTAVAVDRGERREAAYGELRDVERLTSAGTFDGALGAAGRAVRAAREVGDARLIEWAGRVEARTLVAAGRLPDAERRFEALSASAARMSEVAWDAGLSFHLAGALEQALSWYRRIYERRASEVEGRSKAEFIEGIILALGEQGRWREAPAEIERFERAYGGEAESKAEIYRAVAEWRSGGVPRAVRLDREPQPDLLRYWALEVRRARGDERPDRMLEEVREELGSTSECRPLMRSLEAELLADLGRPEEAYEAARDALGGVRFGLAGSTCARGHFDLVTERFAERARALGREEEATAAEAQLLAWRRVDRPGGLVPSGV